MASPILKILYLEDVKADVELVTRELERQSFCFELKNVYNEKDFVKALTEFSPDIILSDHSLPSFDSQKALEIVNTLKTKIPFILITGTVSEEFAVQIIKEGADDYILKDRLQRLPAAIKNVLEKIKFENEKQSYINEVIENEALMKEAEKIAHFGSWQMDIHNNITKWSDETYRIFGFKPGETEPSLDYFIANIHPDDRSNVKKSIINAIRESDFLELKFRIRDKEGFIKHYNNKIIITRDPVSNNVKITGFLQDITEAVLAEEERNKITADLIQQNKNLEQFAYIVSHNLRSPVANIIGFSNILRDMDLTPEEKKDLIGELFTSAAKLDNVIKDLNNILHVKSQVSEKLEMVNFAALVNEIKGSIGSLLKEENVEMEYDFSAAPGMMSLKSYLYSIFFNLVTNSIKYRREDVNPLIEIKSCSEKNKTILLFRDNGMGIDLKKKRGQVFGLYKRFHPHTDGKGIGLFMVKTQVETLGGKIDVRSEVNKGTEFRIEF